MLNLLLAANFSVHAPPLHRATAPWLNFAVEKRL